ncbi:MAG TPA: acyl-CoA thioesterase domain-containing protein [Myxococcota bacterium]|nr:acyl-CoA thioesterase domain-containing protein [Myxococcota bacterium]
MTGFSAATAAVLTPDGRFTGYVPPGWEQGHGTFGGVVLGLLARAAAAAAARDRGAPQRIVSVSADLMAPVFAGPVAGATSVLAQARDSAHVEALLLGPAGARLARMTALMGAPNASGGPEVSPAAPTTQPGAWERAAQIYVGPPVGPAFALNYAYRTNAPVPFSGSEAPRSSGYLRAREPDGPLDVPTLIGLLDAWWPATYVSQTQPNPVVTVGFAAQFPEPPTALSPSEPFFFRGHVVSQRSGTCTEYREMWQGPRLVATNQQVYKFLRP